MCGLIATFNKKGPVNKDVIDLYEEQYHRGVEGFGIILMNPTKPIEILRATEPIKFLVDLNLYQANGIIAHHRNPTSTNNELIQTHPLKVSNKLLKYDYYVIHNGIIHNSGEMMEKHKKLGFEYITETDGKYINSGRICNDSECLAIELALFLEGLSTEIESRGSCAFIVLKVDKESQTEFSLFYGKNETSPLHHYVDNDYLMLSSEGPGEAVEDKKLYEVNLTTKKFKSKELPITFKELPVVTVTPTVNNCIRNYKLLSTHKEIGFNTADNSTQEEIEEERADFEAYNASFGVFDHSKKSWIDKLNLGDKSDVKESFKSLRRETMEDLEALIDSLKHLDTEDLSPDDVEYYTTNFKDRLTDCVQAVVETFYTIPNKEYEKCIADSKQDSLPI